MIATQYNTATELNVNGPCRLVRALTGFIRVRDAKWSEGCSCAPLDRRWVEMLTGVDRC